MTVELISVGTEILLGNIINTNAAYLSEQCALLGLSCYHQSVVGDNEERLEEELRRALSRSDIVILSGGLGPTKDDLTKEVTAKVFGYQLKEDPHTRARIQEYFDRNPRRKITSNNWKQALVPEGAVVIDNHNGTAPGLILEENGKTAVLLPGPPGELRPMFERDIAPYLNKREPEGIYSHMIKICGMGESQVEAQITDLMEQGNPTLAPYAKTGEVHLRITAKADSQNRAEELIRPVEKKLYERFGNLIYTNQEEVTLEEVIVRLLEEKNLTLTTAESCTGGLLAGRIMNVPGASDVYQEGHITYSNEAKEKILGVRHETLETYGAVSPQTAAEMAAGAAAAAGAGAALSVTGIAGPGGGTEDKPVGLVYIGCQVGGKCRVEKYHFTGNREKNREFSVVNALTLLREELLKSSE
ncbi:competence/damage-inducible protein A [Lachnospiraceae bacterium KGMB03038]|nr:competence/damage-inducible protein A [Lachnospiraceae bacterium KGMB03038]